MDHQAKQRKRSAVSSLRALALELGLNTSRRRADLSKDDFIALHAEVAIQCTTPEQKARASEAMQLYVGTVSVPAALPQVPLLPLGYRAASSLGMACE